MGLGVPSKTSGLWTPLSELSEVACHGVLPIAPGPLHGPLPLPDLTPPLRPTPAEVKAENRLPLPSNKAPNKPLCAEEGRPHCSCPPAEQETAAETSYISSCIVSTGSGRRSPFILCKGKRRAERPATPPVPRGSW